jgi:hypothetical protein
LIETWDLPFSPVNVVCLKGRAKMVRAAAQSVPPSSASQKREMELADCLSARLSKWKKSRALKATRFDPSTATLAVSRSLKSIGNH